LLGLTERVAPDREDLHSAWRLFFERMAEKNPVVLLFEDLHWADAALLDFIDYLVDWSRNHPLYVLSLSRPELGERHPTFAARLRNTTALTLEPLGATAMDELLTGLVPGLPAEIRATIRERADGIPLYAVETVRMLLDRGVLEREGAGFRLSGTIDALEVPETLHALIAARLDGLDPLERRLIEDAAVLGKSFTARGLATLSGREQAELEPVLNALVRKELLTYQSDPRSPERGHYGFLQALVQRVAYETLSRRDRRARHLAAAAFLEGDSGIDPDEIAEVIAAHHLDAYAADPAAADAEEVKENARTWLCRAGERAAALAAPDDAFRAFERAARLADGEESARLLERAGDMALAANEHARAEGALAEARALYEAAGLFHDAARTAALHGLSLWALGRGDAALELLEPALAVLADDEPDENVARLAAEAGRLHHFQGNGARAAERIELALEIAEANRYPAVLSDALNTKALLLKKRPAEARALMREALAIALENDIARQALRGYNNLIVLVSNDDRDVEVERLVEDGLELAHARGHREFVGQFGAARVSILFAAGRWDEAFAYADEVPFEPQTAVPGHVSLCLHVARHAYARADVELAERWLGRIAPEVASATDVQHQGLALYWNSLLARADGRTTEALSSLADFVQRLVAEGYPEFAVPMLEDASTLANGLGDPSLALPVVSFVDEFPAARRTRGLEACRRRIHANVAAARGDQDVAADEFAVALATVRNLGKAAHLAPVLADYGRWLAETGRADEAQPLLDESRALFEQMGATLWLERLDRVQDGSREASGLLNAP
jgi:tetratricopeptide (TPR) repeat protein